MAIAPRTANDADRPLTLTSPGAVDGKGLEYAGPYGCSISTGAGAVLNELRPLPGSSIAVFGAGSVGLAAIMAARLTGAPQIITIDKVESRLQLARELGATHSLQRYDPAVNPDDIARRMNTPMNHPQLIETGPWTGWKTWPHDAFETAAGPFYMRKDDVGRVICRFVAEPRHMNGAGFMHGGCFLTFADFACFSIAADVTNGPCVTVNLSGDFLAAARVGDVMEATGEVTRAGGRLIYVRGMVTANGKPALSFTSVITRLSRQV